MKQRMSFESKGNRARMRRRTIAVLLLGALVAFGAAACNTATSECNGDSAGAIHSGSGGSGGNGGAGGSWSPFDAGTTATTGGGCLGPADCDDGNSCTLDYCTQGVCSNPDDTTFSACGDTGAGHCFRAICCEGCIDLMKVACVQTCPANQVCSALGVCTG